MVGGKRTRLSLAGLASMEGQGFGIWNVARSPDRMTLLDIYQIYQGSPKTLCCPLVVGIIYIGYPKNHSFVWRWPSRVFFVSPSRGGCDRHVVTQFIMDFLCATSGIQGQWWLVNLHQTFTSRAHPDSITWYYWYCWWFRNTAFTSWYCRYFAHACPIICRVLLAS